MPRKRVLRNNIRPGAAAINKTGGIICKLEFDYMM